MGFSPQRVYLWVKCRPRMVTVATIDTQLSKENREADDVIAKPNNVIENYEYEVTHHKAYLLGKCEERAIIKEG